MSMAGAATDTAALLESYMPASLPTRRRPATLIRRSSMPTSSSRSAGGGEAGKAAAAGAQNPSGSKTAGGDKGMNGNHQTMTRYGRALPGSQSHRACDSTGSMNLGLGVAPPGGENEGVPRLDVDGRDFDDRLVGERENRPTNATHGVGGTRSGNRSGERSTLRRAQSTKAMITPSVRMSSEAKQVSSQSTTTGNLRAESMGMMAESGGGSAVNVSTSVSDSSTSKHSSRTALPPTTRLTTAASAIDDDTGNTIPALATAKTNSTIHGLEADDGQTSYSQPSRADAASSTPYRDIIVGDCDVERTAPQDTRNAETTIPSYEHHIGDGRTDGSSSYIYHNHGPIKDRTDEWGHYGSLSELDGGERQLVQSEALSAMDFRSQALPISPSEVQPSTDRHATGTHQGVVIGKTKGGIYQDPAVENRRQGRMARPVSGVVLTRATARRFASGSDQQVQPPRPKSWSYRKATSLVAGSPAEDPRNSTTTDIRGIAVTARVLPRGVSSSRLNSRSSSNSKISRIDSLLDMTQVAGEVPGSRPSGMQRNHMPGLDVDASLEDIGAVEGERRSRDDAVAAVEGSEEELEDDFNSDEGGDDQIYYARKKGARPSAKDVDEAFDRTFGQIAHHQIFPSKNVSPCICRIIGRHLLGECQGFEGARVIPFCGSGSFP